MNSGFLLCIFLLIPNTVSANSELIQNFDVKITARKDGTFTVTETIKYDFGQNLKHGIFRDIPTIAKVGDLYRQSKINITGIERDKMEENYSVSANDSKISAKIGRANQTINGVHTYTISYVVQNGIGSNYEDHDEIYWNVTGSDWKVPILSASASISTDFGVIPDRVACFTGSYGSTDKNCTLPANFPETPVTTTVPLSSYQGLTVVAGFPVNTFPKSILSTKPPQDSSAITFSDSDFRWFGYLFFGAFGSINFIFAPLLLIWYLKYKRKKHFGPVKVNFDIPKDSLGKRISPAEAGIIDNAKLEKNDVVATIFDLAIRKYIKLVDKEEKEFFLGIHHNSTKHYIEKVKASDSNSLSGYEKQLYNRLFQDGDSVEISSLSTNFYLTFDLLNKMVFDALVEKGYYTKNPATQKGLLIAGGFASLLLLGPILSAVLFFLSFKLNGRTGKGDEIDFKIDGLKLFLKNMKRHYKWQAENLYTVEKYIPYAMALGFIDKFMEQLKVIYPDYKPNWYSGNMAFYAISNSMVSSISSGFTTVAPGSSSGFSGGGFSGGGGGGGGGGSW